MENFDIEPNTQGKTVLVVDDMEANRSVLSRHLEMHNYAVLSVDSGKAALELLSHSRPDIVLLDYMMPNMNGIEVLHQLRGNPSTADLAVIMVTARAESEATVEALAAGADDYVTKPIDFVALRARIERLVEKRSDTTDLRRSNAVLDERMTMRSLVLADMEVQLNEEVRRREELETKLSQQPLPDVSAASPNPNAQSQLQAVKEKFGTVFENIINGQAPNLAQMYEINAILSDLLEANIESPDPE